MSASSELCGVSSQGTAYRLSKKDDSPTIVLIHGLGLNQCIWDEYVSPLFTDYQVLRYDLVGHGESSLPTDIPSLTLFSNQLLELLNYLNIDNCTLIGFSLGGMINRRFAMDHASRVNALVILNSPHERSEEAQRLVEERAANTQSGGAEATIDSTLQRWFTPSYISNNPQYLSKVRNWVLSNEATCYAHCRHVLATGVIELIRPIPAISIDTLVITCENDSGSSPAMSYAIGQEIANSQVEIIPHLQHMGLVEQPGLFIKPIIKFLCAVYR